jgi:hypothetical protein
VNFVESHNVPFASQKLLPKNPTCGYTCCRIATTYHGYAIATGNLAVLNDKYLVEGIRGRRKALMAGWEGTGDMSRETYNQDHMTGITDGMFPGLPKPAFFNQAFSEVWKKLNDGFVIGLAIRPSVVATTSALRKYTSADHEVLLIDKRLNSKSGHWEGRVIDPMAPRGPVTPQRLESYHGHWVPKTDLLAAAYAVEEDKTAYTELYPIDGWKRQALIALVAKAKG